MHRSTFGRILSRRATRAAIFGACAILSATPSAFAVLSGTVDNFIGPSYTGGTGSNWFDTTLWSTGNTPQTAFPGANSSGDLALIDNGGLIELADPNATATADTIFLGSSAGASGGIRISAGTLSIIGTNPVTIPSGSIGSAGLRIGANNSITTGPATAGIGSFTQSGGTVSCTLAVNIGIGGNGTYTLSGGTLSVPTNAIAIGNGEKNTGISGSTGVSGNGTLIMSGGAIIAQNITVGRTNTTPGFGGNGTFNMTGGSLTLGSLSVGGTGSNAANNQNPQGTMTVSATAQNPVPIVINGNMNVGLGDATAANTVSGTLTIGSNVTLTQNGATVLAIGNGNGTKGLFTNNGGEIDIATGTFQPGRNSGYGSYVQNSGTLNVATFSITGNSAAKLSTLQILGGTANFNGGTLGSNGVLELAVPMTISSTVAYGTGTWQIDSGNTVTLSGTQNFPAARTYTKAGSGTLIVSGGFQYGSGIAGGVTVTQGTYRLQNNAGGSLTVNANGGSTSFETQETLSKIAIGSGGAVGLNAATAGTTHGVTTFTINGDTVPTGKLDITNNNLVINYAAGNSPLTNVKAQVISGYNSGAWNGQGIVSSKALLSSAHPTGVGYGEASTVGLSGSLGGVPVDGDTVIVRYTYDGDTDLSGSVNSSDFDMLAANFGSTSNNGWIQGDFNYDGIVNTLDFNALATNFGLSGASSEPLAATAASLGSVVPEPASIAMLSVGAMGLMRRRRA